MNCVHICSAIDHDVSICPSLRGASEKIQQAEFAIQNKNRVVRKETGGAWDAVARKDSRGKTAVTSL